MLLERIHLRWKVSLALAVAVLLATDPGSSRLTTPDRNLLATSRTGGSRGRISWAASAALHDDGGAQESGASGASGTGARSGSSDDRQSTGTAAESASSGSGSGSSGRAAGGQGGVTGGDAGGDQKGVCSDTCYLARNGICEDGTNMEAATVGGRAVGLQVACDFGTDCSDCGPYRGVVPTWGTDTGFQGPIDFLRRQEVKVWARRVSFEPYFVFAYTDPKEDLDVSEQLERAGCMELGIVQVFRELLAGRCGAFKTALEQAQAQAQTAADPAAAASSSSSSSSTAALPRQPLVVDVGANFGYFAVYAAVMGCRVVAVEPVPRFLAFLAWNLAANGLREAGSQAGTGSEEQAASGAVLPLLPAVRVLPRVVMEMTGMNFTVAAPRKGVWGTASVAGAANNEEQDLEMVTVPSVSLDDLVGPGEQVELLKVDVEGFEPSVLRSGVRVLQEQRVEHIIFEYSPGMPETLERAFQPSEWEALPVHPVDPPRMLLNLLDRGYHLVQMPDNFAKSGYGPQLQQPLPAFEEVQRSHVLHDISDVYWFRNHTSRGGPCPWPAELVRINPTWGDWCFRAPEDSHPKGFRAMFAYNTNIWAARNRTALPISGPVGLFGPEQDDRTTWSSQKRPQQGVGNRACPYLPADKLLRSRCVCTKPEVCGLEQEALLRALREGRMPLAPAV